MEGGVALFALLASLTFHGATSQGTQLLLVWACSRSWWL